MFDSSYLMYVIILPLVIGLVVNANVKHKLKKYSQVPMGGGFTGAQAANQMLAYYNITGVRVQPGASGQNFFDPRSNSITLEPEVYSGSSVTAAATACHECGHAHQFAQNYFPMKVRTALVPAVNLASNAWMFVFLAGLMLQMAGLVNVAIVLYLVVILFALVTLPVEFNASRRAMAYMGSIGLPAAERKGSFSVLSACALTYVAAALISLLNLLWLLSQRQD